MKKKDFISLIMGTAGLILFGIGMCMCLLTSWNAFNQGIIMGAGGLAVLLGMIFVRRKMEGKPMIAMNAKTIGTALLAIIGALALGIGLCMTMVWEGLMIQGFFIGIIGIFLLISLIPICKGLY